MNFINEQNVVLFQVGQERGQVLGLLQHRAAGLAQVDAQFGRNDVGERRFAQARRAKQQHVVQRLATHLGRADENLQLLANLHLTHILVEQLGAQGALNRLLLG